MKLKRCLLFYVQFQKVAQLELNIFTKNISLMKVLNFERIIYKQQDFL